MALTPSNMMALGTKAPDFELFDVKSGEILTLEETKGKKGTLVMFICNHCPYVVHVQKELARIAREFSLLGIGTIGISSNDVENYPADSPDHMRQQAVDLDFIFPYLFDETQDVAQSYDAACTPDFFLFDEALKLVYRGRLDDSRPGNELPVTGKDLREALNRLLDGREAIPKQYPSVGCNIKWKNKNPAFR